MAIASVIGSIGGALISANGAKKAAGKQSRAQDAAIAEQRRASEQSRSDLQPFRDVGERALNPLFDFVSQGPETDFERTQGFDQIQKSAAASGKLQSGETLGALTEFNAGVNERFRNNRFQELLSLANLGQISAAGQANVGVRSGENISSLLVGKGDSKAAGIVGRANAIGTGINEIGSFLGTLKKPQPIRAVK